MGNNLIMRSQDALAAKEASCFVTIKGKRYLLINAKDISARVDKTKPVVDRMGDKMKGHKTTAMEGKGSATFWYNQSVFRELTTNYKDDLEGDLYFDMQIKNEDKTSSVGRQTCILKDCNLDSIVLAKMAAGDDLLEEDADFTFEDWNYPELFKQLAGTEA